jgi:hypothetical protein
LAWFYYPSPWFKEKKKAAAKKEKESKENPVCFGSHESLCIAYSDVSC